MLRMIAAAIATILGNSLFGLAESAVQAQPVTTVKDGIRIHRLRSPWQAGDTTLRVLLPEELPPGERCRVLYVLPVHEDGVFRHGDGLQEVRKLNVHNQFQLICVSPAFSSEPWYADHDQNPAKQDEGHLLKTVIPFVEANYAARKEGSGRLLLGFSKSGWGAMTLLLRHPDLFHKAAAWDPGIRIDVGPFGADFDRKQRIRTSFGTDENFEKYRLSALLKVHGSGLGEEVRLFYFNRAGGIRTSGGRRLHQLMIQHRVAHRYVLGVHRPHRWDSGWLPEALRFLTESQ